MRATLSFNLEEPDDRVAHLRATLAFDMAIALSELRDLKRKLFKVDYDTVESLSTAVNEGIDEIFESLPVSLDELLR